MILQEYSVVAFSFTPATFSSNEKKLLVLSLSVSAAKTPAVIDLLW